jgi:cytochrome c2
MGRLEAALLGLAVAGASLGPVHAEGDPVVGGKRYRASCVGCHGDAKTPAGMAPSLVNIMGRKAGEAAGGVISRASAEANFVWDETTLDQFLASPSEKIHGTLMPIGVKNPRERADLIAYIKTMK